MADGGRPKPRRFSAFVSYSSEDAAFTRRLHRLLETYRLPRKLRKLKSDDPPPERLKPLFRDVDELTAFYDLTAAVRDALAQSDFLIVVCSPNAVQSEWVGREIEYFRELRGDGHILAVLIDGTPATAFHPALLPVAEGRTLEPLAADFRPESGSRRLAMLKLVAALAGVELDQLVHRDAQRQQRRTLAVAAGSMAAALVVGVLTTLILTARAETDRKRQQAGGLVDHMLTDVRKNLQRTGRLDQLAAVNESAMAYYRGQDLARLTDDELRQRAKLLQAMGEDDEKRGNLDKARKAFVEAHRTTAKLLAAKPNDTERIFAHAQSEYWVGFINWRNGDGAAARSGFEAYAKLAQRLVDLEPGNDAWLMERAYANGNLGTLLLRQTAGGSSSQGYFLRALQDKQLVAQHQPGTSDPLRTIAQTYAWLADSQRMQGDFDAALISRRAQERILVGLFKTSPADVELQSEVLGLKLALARIEADRGNVRSALAYLRSGEEAAAELANRDPENDELARQRRIFQLFEARAWLALPSSKRSPSASIALAKLKECHSNSRSDPDRELESFCRALQVRMLNEAGRTQEAEALSRSILSAQTDQSDVLTPTWGINLRDEVLSTVPIYQQIGVKS